MNYKFLALLIIGCCISEALFADRYKVLFVNSKNITINGRRVKKGLIFDDKSAIVWGSDKQAMKVLNLTNNRVYIIPAKYYDEKQSTSLWEYLKSGFQKINHLSTYGLEIGSRFDDRRLLLDTIHIELENKPGRGSQYFAIVHQDGQRISIPLKCTKDSGALIIRSKDLWSLSNNVVSLDIVEKNREESDEVILCGNLMLEILPLKIK